jgi:hypothetical protein
MRWLAVLGLLLFPAAISSAQEGASCGETARCAQGCPSDRLAACVEECAAKLSAKARPYYEALQNCSKKTCMDSCKDAASTSCKCSSELSACLVH